MFNYKAVISYNGTNFCGFQRQNGQRTVQEVIEKGLLDIVHSEVVVVASGRTDSGVHAKGQVISFHINETKKGSNEPLYTPEAILRSLNSLMPQDVRIISCEFASNDFSSRFSAIEKTYSYTIFNGDILSPFLAPFASHIRPKIYIEKMREGIAPFIGKKNFKSLCKTGAQVKDHIREVTAIEIKEEQMLGEEVIKIYITGKSFLHNMCRVIATSLINCGTGKFTPKDIEDYLAEEKRTAKVVTAEAKGLCLEEVRY